MSRLLLIRHGETAHNADGRLSTAAPGGPLTELGREQAERLAEELAATSLEAVYTSPLVRARQTAEAIARRQGLAVTVHDDLAEISTGELDGRIDKEAFDTLNRALDAWCQCEFAVRIGRDGDLGTEVCERFGRLIGEVAGRHPGGPIALVSHGGLLQVGAPWLAENLPPGFALRRSIRNTGIVELEAVAGRVECVAWEGWNPADLVEG
jgi:broad specificity phosphatase PhoE